jgi:hypothetical protein
MKIESKESWLKNGIYSVYLTVEGHEYRLYTQGGKDESEKLAESFRKAINRSGRKTPKI